MPVSHLDALSVAVTFRHEVVHYQVRALDAHQQFVALAVDAPDEANLRAQLAQRGLTAVHWQADEAANNRANSGFPLLLFAQELHALLVAGLSVIEALDVLARKEKVASIEAVLQRLVSALRDGLRLSAALACEPRLFPPLFVGILQAAEGSGDLPRALARYVDYETRLNSVKQKIIAAAIYPAILMGVGGLVAAFLLGHVVPKFALVYQSGGRPLPWASQLLLDWGDFAGAHALPLLAGLAAVVCAAIWWARAQIRQGAWWRVLTVIPGTEARLELLELSRLYLTLGILLEGGLPISQALDLASAVLTPARRAAMVEVSQRIAQGEPLSAAFAATSLSTSVSDGLLKVGERSGQLGKMLVRTAEFYEGETTRWIERFTKAFEPILMAGIGLVIGLIVLLLYMPIFDLAGSLR